MRTYEQYWERRFGSEGMIWGTEPSPTAWKARELFLPHNVRTVFVPGAGYGRNTKAFSREFIVEGVELSETAVKLASEWDPDSEIRCGSALDDREPDEFCDAVYCYDLLHLFLEPERRKLVAACLNRLRPGGFLYFTGFSDEDPCNGRGESLEPGTYRYKEGKYAHFFSEKDWAAHFSGTDILETGTLHESLNGAAEGKHDYILRTMFARKKG
ncbi:class I SAM-dependent methyltransferase [Paenibacillus rhizophilus]|uniref:Class I SAM-dependent methyltransferase n=1 Tax=Paenibacillus rhizophilus TaxID=1850366 RepID=A0A3N9P7L9_9BACL|nr:class I SAM-dependent methyltransferase [Paenibacillus rhizophilus]RQW11307.1 class I SAM-dependent methyltransferase [Paenibacillus rhizophilus]